MRAVVLTKITNAQDISLTEIEKPKAKRGWVVIKIKGFGLNHSEQILRQDEIRADYITKPIVPGIECVGEIAESLDKGFPVGQKVVALMGGMGRNFNGSYAEYALLPISHVFPVQCALPWATLAAIPETYYTAWGSLFECLYLKPDDVLLIRGGTCGLGYAAIQLAKAYGCRVLATTHKKEKLNGLLAAGADEAIFDDGALAGKVAATKALELVGAKSLRDTLRCVARGGIVCNTGILGGEYYLNGFDPIKEIPNGVCLTGFFSNSPTKGEIQNMMTFIEKNKLEPKIATVFPFEDIKKALLMQERGGFNGKIVVTT